MDAEGPGDQKDRSRNRWLPQLTRASTWLLATVVAAVIGVVVQGYLGGWLPGVDGGDDRNGNGKAGPKVPRAAS